VTTRQPGGGQRASELGDTLFSPVTPLPVATSHCLTVWSSDPENTALPSPLTATAMTQAACPSKVRRRFPAATSQCLTVLSSDPENTVLSSPLTATALTEDPWPSKVRRPFPVATSHCLTVWSSEAENIDLPSPLTATAKAEDPWPPKVRTSFPLAASHCLTVWSPDAENTDSPSPLRVLNSMAAPTARIRAPAQDPGRLARDLVVLAALRDGIAGGQLLGRGRRGHLGIDPLGGTDGLGQGDELRLDHASICTIAWSCLTMAWASLGLVPLEAARMAWIRVPLGREQAQDELGGPDTLRALVDDVAGVEDA
jgi:hypothetical protein